MPKKRRKTRKKFPKLLKIGEYCVIIGVQGDVYEYVTNSPVVKKKVVKMSFPQLRDGGCFMCKASEVGKIVVNKCLENDIFVNTQKLQKLLTLMQIECLRISDKPLFKEDILIWDCGVAIKEVNNAFGDYAVEFTEEQDEFIVLLEKEEVAVNNVLNKYGQLEAIEINEQPIIESLRNAFKNNVVEKTPHISVDDLAKWLKNYDNN